MFALFTHRLARQGHKTIEMKQLRTHPFDYEASWVERFRTSSFRPFGLSALVSLHFDHFFEHRSRKGVWTVINSFSNLIGVWRIRLPQILDIHTKCKNGILFVIAYLDLFIELVRSGGSWHLFGELARSKFLHCNNLERIIRSRCSFNFVSMAFACYKTSEMLNLVGDCLMKEFYFPKSRRTREGNIHDKD